MLGIGPSLVRWCGPLVPTGDQGITSRARRVGTCSAGGRYSGFRDRLGATEMRDLADRIVASDSSGSVVGAWAVRQGYALCRAQGKGPARTVRAVTRRFSRRTARGGLSRRRRRSEGARSPRYPSGRRLADSIGAKAGGTVRVVSCAIGRRAERFRASRLCRTIGVIVGYRNLTGFGASSLLDGYRILDPVSSGAFVRLDGRAFADLSGRGPAAREARARRAFRSLLGPTSIVTFTSVRTPRRSYSLHHVFDRLVVVRETLSSALVMLVSSEAGDRLSQERGAPPGRDHLLIPLRRVLKPGSAEPSWAPDGGYFSPSRQRDVRHSSSARERGNLSSHGSSARWRGDRATSTCWPAYFLEADNGNIDFGEIFFNIGTLVCRCARPLFRRFRAGAERPSTP
jgi:hypothetical protein